MGRRLRADQGTVTTKKKRKQIVDRVSDEAVKHSRFQFRCPLCNWLVWTEGQHSKEGFYPGREPTLNTERIDAAPYLTELVAVIFGGKGQIEHKSYKNTTDEEALKKALYKAIERLYKEVQIKKHSM